MVYIEIAIVAALIIINGVFAMAELAVISSRRPRLQALVEQQVPGSRRALALSADPGRFLSTVQIGITLVGVLSGAFSGATLGLRLSAWLETIGIAGAIADGVGVGVVVALITYASLIAGELVPKQLALRNPEKIAARIAPFMTFLARVGSPLVALLDISGRMILRLMGQSAPRDQRVSEDEIRTLMAEAETAGIIEPAEREMMSSVMRLGDRPVRAVMTPRREVEIINLANPPDDIRRAIATSVHSRFPVIDGVDDEIIGVVQAKDILDAYMTGEATDVRQHVRPAPAVPDTADALDVVDSIKASPVHMALVMDEYGHFEGLVTNADILESIVGAFRTDEGPPEPGAVRRGDGSWLISGSLPVDEMAEVLGLALPKIRRYHTAAGYVLERFGYLPSVGESVVEFGWRIEVVDLDRRRIDKLLAQRIES